VIQARLVFFSFPNLLNYSLVTQCAVSEFNMSSGVVHVDLHDTIGALQIGSSFAIFLFGNGPGLSLLRRVPGGPLDVQDTGECSRVFTHN